jgi:hypothetical protein
MKRQRAELMQLHVVAAERPRVPPPNAREEQKRSVRDRRRQVVAAKPGVAKRVVPKAAAASLDPDRTPSELHQRPPALVKRQLGRSVTKEENARPTPRRGRDLRDLNN